MEIYIVSMILLHNHFFPILTMLFPTSNLSPSMQSCILPTEEPGDAEEVLAGLRE